MPEARPGMNAYWRSLAGRAWAAAAGADGGFPGPVHLNLPLRDPLVPGLPDARSRAAGTADGAAGTATPLAGTAAGGTAGRSRWPGGPAGRRGPGGPARASRGRWTCRGPSGGSSSRAMASPTRPGCSGWPPRRAGRCWPSRRPGRGSDVTRSAPTSTCSTTRVSCAAHRPDLVICAGRPGLSRGQTAFLRQAAADGARQVVLAQGPGRWADPARTATDVAAAVRLAGACRARTRPAGWGTGRRPTRPPAGRWTRSWTPPVS